MDTVLAIIGLIAGFIGLLGVIVPVLPGTLFSYLGLICVYFTTSSTVTVTQLIIWGVVSVIAIVLDYVLPGYFSKLFGGTKAGITGATVGTFVGIFFGVPGIILGPFAGAVIGEMISAKVDFAQALIVGFGSMLSFLVGTGIKLIAGIFMMYYIFKDFINIVGDAF